MREEAEETAKLRKKYQDLLPFLAKEDDTTVLPESDAMEA